MVDFDLTNLIMSKWIHLTKFSFSSAVSIIWPIWRKIGNWAAICMFLWILHKYSTPELISRNFCLNFLNFNIFYLLLFYPLLPTYIHTSLNKIWNRTNSIRYSIIWPFQKLKMVYFPLFVWRIFVWSQIKRSFYHSWFCITIIVSFFCVNVFDYKMTKFYFISTI